MALLSKGTILPFRFRLESGWKARTFEFDKSYSSLRSRPIFPDFHEEKPRLPIRKDFTHVEDAHARLPAVTPFRSTALDVPSVIDVMVYLTDVRCDVL